MLKILCTSVKSALKLPTKTGSGGLCKVTQVGATKVSSAAGRMLANTMEVSFEISKISSAQKAASQKAWNSAGTDQALNNVIKAELAKDPTLSAKMGAVTSKKVA